MKRPFRVLDLFAGSRSVARALASHNVETFSVDIKAFDGIDLRCDLEFLHLGDLPWTPNLVWASLPCTSYSIAGIKWHRRGIEPVSEFARKSDRLLARLLAIVFELDVDYVIENPRGMLRKMPQMQDLPRRTVTYCTYGDRRMKPTDLWSNMFSGHDGKEPWITRPPCVPESLFCNHDRQSRSYAKRKSLGLSRLGTQGMSGAYDRSKVPAELICEAVEASAKRIGVDLSSRALTHA